MHMKNKLLLFTILLIIPSFIGCASLNVKRSIPFDSNNMNSKILYLKVIAKSMSSPGCLINSVNLIWTPDSPRDQAVKSAIESFKSDLKSYGFQFVDVLEASGTIAQLEISSVRFDPFAGWITDSVVMIYRNRETDEQIGNITAGGVFFTPGLWNCFGRLTKGTIKLWGIKTPNEGDLTLPSMKWIAFW